MSNAVPQYSLTHLLMFVALVAILLALGMSERVANWESMICDLEFSSDGKQLLVTRYDARDAGVPRKAYSDLLCRTISVVDVATGMAKDLVEGVTLPHRGPSFPVY